MIRIVIACNQYMSNLPIIEMELQLFYDRNVENEINAYQTVSGSIEIIEQIVKECNGNFLSTMPRGKIDKNAKMAVFITISFVYFEQIEKFQRLITQAFC